MTNLITEARELAAENISQPTVFYKDKSQRIMLRLCDALEKRKNGNGTPRAYAAQRELAKRHGTIKPHSSRADGSTKRFSHNEDYMGFETDNR
jgi:hypothetical protein